MDGRMVLGSIGDIRQGMSEDLGVITQLLSCGGVRCSSSGMLLLMVRTFQALTVSLREDLFPRIRDK